MMVCSGYDWYANLNCDQEYCGRIGAADPVYTRYLVPTGGFRFEVEVAGSSYFGTLKSYRSENIAKNASAHQGLYTTIVKDVDDTALFPGVAFTRSGFANSWEEYDKQAPKIAKKYPPIFDPKAITGLESRRLVNSAPQQQTAPTQGKKRPNPATNPSPKPAQKATPKATPKAPTKQPTNPPVPYDLNTKGGRRRARRAGIEVPPVVPPVVPAVVPPTGPKTRAAKKQKTDNGQTNPVNPPKNPKNPNNINNPNPFAGENVPSLIHQPWKEEFGGSAPVWNATPRQLGWEIRNCGSHKDSVKSKDSYI
jgi:hypothetical protein